ncbi:unnamed protein product [Moneuplotes crassus]|uniref:Uncharacterized protein n=1 Tax=Euplotes crassus TaxID=5936 RepID=A0AAD1U3K6_EUPCR|nr:unnamed protein product [Moneuplotes crassus]
MSESPCTQSPGPKPSTLSSLTKYLTHQKNRHSCAFVHDLAAAQKKDNNTHFYVQRGARNQNRSPLTKTQNPTTPSKNSALKPCSTAKISKNLTQKKAKPRKSKTGLYRPARTSMYRPKDTKKHPPITEYLHNNTAREDTTKQQIKYLQSYKSMLPASNCYQSSKSAKKSSHGLKDKGNGQNNSSGNDSATLPTRRQQIVAKHLKMKGEQEKRIKINQDTLNEIVQQLPSSCSSSFCKERSMFEASFDSLSKENIEREANFETSEILNSARKNASKKRIEAKNFEQLVHSRETAESSLDKDKVKCILIMYQSYQMMKSKNPFDFKHLLALSTAMEKLRKK